MVQYDEFLDRVQKRAGLASRDEAVRATQATLETLGERVYRSARDDVAAQLPKGLKEHLSRRAAPQMTPQDVDRFMPDEFYHRISARAGVGYPAAVVQARAVMATLREAISAGEWQDLREELPPEYEELLGAG